MILSYIYLHKLNAQKLRINPAQFPRILLLSLLIMMSMLSCGKHAFSQSTTKLIRGEVLNTVSGLGIKEVVVSTLDFKQMAKTNGYGGYSIRIPKTVDSLLFQHPLFATKVVRIKKKHHRVLDTEMTRLIPDAADLPNAKTSVSFLPLKFITGALSLRVAYFIKTEHALGAYVTWYYNGRQYFGNERFTALKATPYYRYYYERNKSFGAYIQLGAIIGYFDFTNLEYNYSNKLNTSVPAFFWTGGFGFATGIEDIVKMSGVALDINIGFQYLPPRYPVSVTNEHGTVLEHNNTWWFLGGPGSLVEIKISIGGLF